MTKVFIFKNSVFCGVFSVSGDLEQWKNSFCLNNVFDQDQISLVTISEEDMQKYDTIFKTPNVSRIVFEGVIKIIATHKVDNKEIVIETLTPITII